MEMTGLEWEYIDEFEFVVVVACFLTLTHKCLHTLWYAARAPIPLESVFLIAAKAVGWAASLAFYLMFRVDTLIIAGLIGLPIILLAVTLAVLASASVSSAIAYSGLGERWADRLSAFLTERSAVFWLFLMTLVPASASKAATCLRACGEYAAGSSPLIQKRLGAMRDRVRMFSVRLAQK